MQDKLTEKVKRFGAVAFSRSPLSQSVNIGAAWTFR